jgi:hypothetical protein
MLLSSGPVHKPYKKPFPKGLVLLPEKLIVEDNNMSFKKRQGEIIGKNN